VTADYFMRPARGVTMIDELAATSIFGDIFRLAFVQRSRVLCRGIALIFASGFFILHRGTASFCVTLWVGPVSSNCSFLARHQGSAN
jgi:hypothetical protein